MGLPKSLFGRRTKREEDDNPYSDDDDFSFRDRQAARFGDSRHRDTVEEERRDSDNWLGHYLAGP